MTKLFKISRPFVPIVYLLHNQNIKSYQILCKNLPVKNIFFYSTSKISKKEQEKIQRDAHFKYQLIPKSSPKMKRADLRIYREFNNSSTKPRQIIHAENPKRADDGKNYQGLKKLPKLNNLIDDCPDRFIPTEAPKLKRPKPLFDDKHMKRRHTSESAPKNGKPERMDDIRGYDGKTKMLPPYLNKED